MFTWDTAETLLSRTIAGSWALPPYVFRLIPVCMSIGHRKRYEYAYYIRKSGPYERESDNNGGKLWRTVGSARLFFPFLFARSFVVSRPALAWQSEQIGRLNLSELQRRVSAGFCYVPTRSLLHRAPPSTLGIRSRFATSNQTEFARVVRKTESRHRMHIIVLNVLNKRTNIVRLSRTYSVVLCHASMRA